MNSSLYSLKKRFPIFALASMQCFALLHASDAVDATRTREVETAHANAARLTKSAGNDPHSSSESRGALEGSIETSEGRRVSGAEVSVDTVTITSADGLYTFPGLRAGTHTITVSAVGFQTATLKVTLLSDQTLAQKIVLENEVPVQLESVIVKDSVSSNSIAFDNKAVKDGVNELVQGADLTRQGAQDATDALKGVTGVAVSRSSDGSSNIAIRGLAPQLNRVTVDGQRQSNQGRFSGSNALDSLPPEILQAIEVQKVITPDMDADTIGGTISVSTADASALKKPFLQTKEQLVYGTMSERVGARSSVTIGGPFSLWSNKPDSGAIASISYDRTYRSSQSLESTDNWPELISPGPEPYMGIPVPAFTKVNLQEGLELRRRYSILFNADTKLGATLVYVKLNFTRDRANRAQAQMLFDPAEGLPTSLTPSRGAFSGVHVVLQGSERATVRDMATASFGQKSDFGRIHLTSNVGYSSTRESLPNAVYSNFQSKDPFNISYNFSGNSGLPVFGFSAPSSTSSNENSVLDPSEYRFNQLFILNNAAKDHILSGQSDAKIDLGPTAGKSYLKFGIKASRFDRQVVQRRDVYNENEASPPISAEGLVRTPITTYTDPQYFIGPITDPALVEDFWRRNPSLFEPSETETKLSSNASNYSVGENIWEGYGMAHVEWDAFSVLTGLRLEATNYNTESLQPLFSNTGAPTEFVPWRTRKSYLNTLPGLHFRYDALPKWIFRASSTFTLKRADYGDVAPYYLNINYPLKTVRTGNPDLKPYRATNFDLSADYYDDKLGLLGWALFYKRIKDFQVDEQDIINFADLGDFLRTQAVNGSTAEVAGIELSWRSRSFSLSNLAKGVFLSANYSYTQSRSEVPGRPGETLPLPLQARNQVNVTLHAEKGPLSFELSTNYSSKTLGAIVSTDHDQYRKGSTNVDASATLKLRKNVNLVVACRNLTEARTISYVGSESQLGYLQFNEREWSASVNSKF